MEVSRNQEAHSLPLESFMDQTDLGISIVANSCDEKNISPVTPVSVSLPAAEPVNRTIVPISQLKKTAPTSISSQVQAF